MSNTQVTYELCDSASLWETAMELFPESNFLQSWAWGEFQQKMGKTVVRLLFQSENKTVGLAQLIREPARRGTYAAIAGGPLLDWTDATVLRSAFHSLRLEARKLGCTFIRFRPQATIDQVSPAVLKQLGAVTAPMHLTADLTIEIDLTKTPEQLLSDMRKQHRQAIKKAASLGIEVRQSQNADDLRDFYQAQVELAQRHGFVPFSYEFLLEQFKTFVVHDQVVVFHAYLGSKLLASAFVIFYHGAAVYHYGISTAENQSYPGSYACQWAIIQEAQRRHCATYNLWGVSPKDDTSHRFYGVGLFKRGFGGMEVAYVPAQDIPLQPTYWFTWAFELMRKKFRRL